MDRPLVIADTFERRSGIPQRLVDAGPDVEVRGLGVGDYAAGRTLIERKTVLDLHGSIMKGRFWPQIGRLRLACGLPYLLVEGDDLDAGPLRPNAIRGACLALAELGVRVIGSRDADDSARWLSVLARRRRSSERPAYTQRPKLRRDDAEAMLAAVRGISRTTARALLDRFGSVENVLRSDESEWLSVPGVGPSRARALRRAISEQHRGS